MEKNKEFTPFSENKNILLYYMSYTSDYLLYTTGDPINNIDSVRAEKFYQIDNINDTRLSKLSATDENVYYLQKIMRDKVDNGYYNSYYNVYYFNPMREYIFKNDFSKGIMVLGDKNPKIDHLTKIITEADLLTKYSVYNVLVELNRGGFLSYVPLVGTSLNKGLGYVPGGDIAADALYVTQKVGTGVTDAITRRGGYGKRKRKTKKNKRKIKKTKRKSKRKIHL